MQQHSGHEYPRARCCFLSSRYRCINRSYGRNWILCCVVCVPSLHTQYSQDIETSESTDRCSFVSFEKLVRVCFGVYEGAVCCSNIGLFTQRNVVLLPRKKRLGGFLPLCLRSQLLQRMPLSLQFTDRCTPLVNIVNCLVESCL